MREKLQLGTLFCLLMAVIATAVWMVRTEPAALIQFSCDRMIYSNPSLSRTRVTLDSLQLGQISTAQNVTP